MPRKSIPRAFKLVCKHYKSFDRSFSAKAIATRKFHASQGVIVNQKLAGAPDYKYGKSTGRPLVKNFSSGYPSFASQPLAAHSRCASHLAHIQHTPAASTQRGPEPPIFAAVPLWQSPKARADPAHSSAPEAAPLAQSAHATEARERQLVADPLYQYAAMDQPHGHDRDHASRAGRKQERSALRWYGSLDRRPISKPSSSSPVRSHSRSEHSRMAAAFAAYADLDGPKH